ncbi:MAG: YibE/F family protein [Bacillota bacterium]|nr:YibE/F family protein [Bacillota bacterium]
MYNRGFLFFITVIFLASTFFTALPVSAQNVEDYPIQDSYEEYYYRGRVLEVNETEEKRHEYFTMIEQELIVELTSGPYKGEVLTIINNFFAGDPVYDFLLDKGQEVIVVTIGEEGSFEQAYVQDMVRDRGVYYLVAIFLIVLLVVGRMKGLKTIITLAVTIFMIFTFLLPLLLKGISPILLAVLTATAAITFTLLVIGGINMKSIVAILGTIAGVIVAGMMAYWAGSMARLTGFGTHEAQMLYFLDHTIDFRGLLFAGIIIGSLGAITDIGMSVASAAAEIRQVCPDIHFRELFRGAFNVGRDVMGTMANTLILAYVGSAIPMLLLVMGNRLDWLKVINMDMIATEFVRGIAGSIGLVVAVPVTAVLAGYLLAGKRG